MANKIILITGANRGIGLAIAQALAERTSSLTVLMSSRSRSNAEAAVKQLQDLGLKSDFRSMQLDVSNDDSIKEAVSEVNQRFGKLDVLINNAGIAGDPIDDSSSIRAVYNQIMDVNVASVAVVSTLFLPLLRKSAHPRVINVSSARGSFGMVTSGANPPTLKIPYSGSKAALNLLTVELGHGNTDVEFQAVNPGWCKTGFNGFRGPRDPLEGAIPAVELALSEKGKYKPGFWVYENGKMEEVPW